MRFWLLWLCLSSAALGESVTVESVLAVSGLVKPSTVGDLLVVDPQSKPVLVAIGLVRVNAPSGAQVKIRVEDAQRKRITSRELSPNVFTIEQTGRFYVDVTIVDFDKKLFEQEMVEVVVGPPAPPLPPGPSPPPNPGPAPPNPGPPSPNIPNDEFGNLAQRIDTKCDEQYLQVDLRLRLAEVYSQASAGMTTLPLRFKTQHEVSLFVSQQKASLAAHAFTDVFKLMSDEAVRHTPMSWEEIARFYAAIAIGLKG